MIRKYILWLTAGLFFGLGLALGLCIGIWSIT